MRHTALILSVAVATLAPVAAAQSEPSPGAAAGATSPPGGPDETPAATAPSGTAFFPEAPAEAPPPLPRKKGLVLESGLGALAFLGKFGNTAPAAPWVDTELGWEFFKWLMLFGYGELGFTGTSSSQPEASATYFPVYGFGGGLRFTVHATERVAFFLQGSAGAISAIVPRGTLAIVGFQNAENLGFAAGGRLGVEWYQIDRHMALTLGVGLRDAFNFKLVAGGSDLPLVLDASLAIRYTF